MTDALEYDKMFWIGGNSGIEKTNLKNWYKHWTKERVQRKCVLYDLLDHGTYMEGFEPEKISEHKKLFYKRCQLPPKLSSPLVILIFGNKTAQILWAEQSFAFVIESKEIKDSFMKYFFYFWKDPW